MSAFANYPNNDNSSSMAQPRAQRRKPLRSINAQSFVAGILSRNNISPLHRAGLFARVALALAYWGYRFISDKNQWVHFSSAIGCYANVDNADVVGAVGDWILSNPLNDEKRFVLEHVSGSSGPAIQADIAKMYDAANEVVVNNLPWRNAVPKQIAGHLALLTKAADYDFDPEVLNCPNGYLNLRTLEFTSRTGFEGPLFRQSVACDYDPEAQAPMWEKYLKDAHPGDDLLPPQDQVIPYLQYIAGTAAIGRMAPYRAGFWIYGPSTTGKSVFSNTLRWLLGSYATQLHVALLMRSGAESRMASTLADLPGKRLACINEVSDGQIDDTTFKALTSTDGEVVRPLYREGVTVRFTHTLLTTTNHQPVINDTGGAVFERLRTIPFVQRVAHPDNDLEEKLKAEASGILNWVIAGAYRVLNDLGLYATPPKAVRDGVAAYREEMNIVASFIEDCCEMVESNFVTSTDSLFAVFKLWCRDINQMTKTSRRKFIALMREAGYEFGRFGAACDGNRIRGVTGIRINNEYEQLLAQREEREVKTGNTIYESEMPTPTCDRPYPEAGADQ